MKESHRVVRGIRIKALFRWIVLLSLCHLDPTVGTAPPALSQQVTENEIKAALAFKFPIYVSWPEIAWNGKGESFQCCILGESPLTDLLMQFEGQTLGERRIRVERLSDIDATGECNMLFIGQLEGVGLPEIWRAIEGRPILTLGDQDGFAERGGIINFIRKKDSIHFEINPAAGKRAGLEISSKLLRLARIIEEGS